jgi:ubiquinone/menaquinone biosynthesis C-methylase UbiE
MELFQGKRIPLNETFFNEPALARFYDEHARRFMGMIYRRFADNIVELNFTGKRVLDIGTGTGLLALVLAQKHPDWQLTGIDISEDMLKIARETAARNELAGNTEFRQSPAEALPFPGGTFDLVVSNASLHLWKDPVKVFDEMARVAGPGGYCLIWDNLRPGIFTPFLGLPGAMMGMNTDQRRLWMKAVGSSYTPGEAKALLKPSAMKGARIKTHLSLFELGIEWKKPHQETSE